MEEKLFIFINFRVKNYENVLKMKPIYMFVAIFENVTLSIFEYYFHNIYKYFVL